MANRNFKDRVKTLESEVCHLYGQVTFGSSGAIASQNCKGFSVAQTGSEDGRYTVTLEDQYNTLLFVGCNIEGAADTAFGATGLIRALRNVAMTSKTFDIQLVEADGNLADTDPASGDILYIMIAVKNSSLNF